MCVIQWMEMHKPGYRCTLSAFQADVSQVMLYLYNYTRLQKAGAIQIHSHIGQKHTTRMSVIEVTMLQEFDKNLQTSLRARKRVFSVHRSSIMRILHKDTQHLYNLK